MIKRFGVCILVGAMWVYGALVPASAADLKKIVGEYVVAPRDGQELVELGLIIRGQAAKELYEALPVSETPDACTGGMQKSDPKGMFCINDNKDFTCSLGYVLKTRAVTAGPLSC